jgi:adenylate kinase
MKRLKDLILMGAPGSGKGSQSNMLKELGYVHISTGDLLRAEIASGSELGKEISAIIDKGNLINDQLALSLIKSKVNDNQSFIFDGFPRTVVQAVMLDEQVLTNREVQVILFDIKDSDLLDRIVNRRTCSNCGAIFNLQSNPTAKENTCDDCGHVGLSHRKDDEASVLKTRLEVYHKSTTPVIEYYKAMNRVITLNANRPADSLFQDIQNLIAPKS